MPPTRLLFLALVVLLPSGVHAKTPITWNVTSLSQRVLTGTTSSVEVLFSSSEALSNVQIRVTPALQRFVSTVPSNFVSVPKGQSQTLTITFSLPTNAPFGNIFGVIHIKDGSRTLAKPLEVEVQAAVPTSTDIPSTVGEPSPDRISSLPDLGDTKYVLDEVDLFFKDGTSNSTIIDVISQVGGVFLGSIPELNFYQVKVPQQGFDNLSVLIDQLKNHPAVDTATHSYLISSFSNPNDPLYPESYGAELIELPSAWDIETGKKVIVGGPRNGEELGIAIVDSVFSDRHLDLRDNIARFTGNNYPLIDSMGNIDFHGTAVASIVAAKGNNAEGIAGVMWDASLRLYSAKSPVGDDAYYLPTLEAKVRLAIDDRPRILNFSGGAGCTTVTAICTSTLEEMDAIFFRLLLRAERMGVDVLWVFAAGKHGTNVQRCSPARLSAFFSNVVSVSSVDRNKVLDPASNYGAAITVSAPGVSILSAAPGNSYRPQSGTSFAAPYVSGVAGLMLSVNPNLSASQLKSIISSTATATGNFDPEGNSVRLLNAFRAIQEVDLPQQFQFLSFVEGDPKLPGDELTINPVGGLVNFSFDFITPFVFQGPNSDGITITVFPASGNPPFQDVGLIISNLLPPGPCEITASTGGFLTRQTVLFNGFEGRIVYVPQEVLVAIATPRPGCSGSTNNMYIVGFYYQGDSSTPDREKTLDAATIGYGPDAYPGLRTQ